MPKGKRHSAELKFRVALEAAKGTKTLAELASEYCLHPSQISAWKGQLLSAGVSIFSTAAAQEQRAQAGLQAELYEQIGRLQMELEWLKKKLPPDLAVRRALIEPDHVQLSIRQQCKLLGLNRATFYYEPVAETDLNLSLMRLIDEQYTRTPFYGWPRMTAYLRHQGYAINPKRVRRLLHVMGLQAIYPKRHTTVATPGHKVYPYLLHNLVITRSSQVWSVDITYVPMVHGFMYLVAIIDWYSRYVVAWQLSNTLDGRLCLEAPDQALAQGQPDISSTDQGAQFTATAFPARLEAAGVRVSMDGRGRALDNVFVERLWRSVKYEHVYPYAYETVVQLEQGLGDYFRFYNHERPHQSLAYQTPAQLHFAGSSCPAAA